MGSNAVQFDPSLMLQITYTTGILLLTTRSDPTKEIALMWGSSQTKSTAVWEKKMEEIVTYGSQTNLETFSP